MAPQSRSHCITWNNYPDNWKAVITHLVDDNKLTYFAGSEELAPTTGTPHIQGWVYNKNKMALSWFGRVLKANACVMRGSFAQNDEYCSKAGDLWEYGTKPEQGARNDIQTALKKVEEGEVSITELIHADPDMYAKYRCCFEHISKTIKPPIRLPLDVQVWYGPPGTGKSTRAAADYPDHFKYYGQDFFDGYTGQSTLILDEFTCNVPINRIKLILDHHAFWCNIKNSGMWAKWTTVIIITNETDPENHFYRNCDPIHRQAFLDRIRVWMHCYGTSRRIPAVFKSLDMDADA